MARVLGPDLADLVDGAPGAAPAVPAGARATTSVSRRRSPNALVADLLDATLDVAAAPPARRGARRSLPALAGEWARAAPGVVWPPLLAALVVLVAWEAWIEVRDVPPYLAPAPTAVAAEMAGDPSRYLEAGVTTLRHAVGGLVLGTGVAFLLGVVMAHSRTLERALYPQVLLVKVTPVIALAPLLIIWLGFGDWPKVIVAALITFFPMLVAAIRGLRSVDPAAHDFLRSLDASRWQVFWRLRLPASLPFLFAALRISIPLALIGAVVAEWVSADSGTGQVIVIAHGELDTAAIFGAIVVLAVIGVTLTAAVALLERRLLFWHESAGES